MSFPLSIGMTPAFYDDEHRLLRLQLRCLAQQTCRDFDIWLIDPHYQKRRAIIPEFITLRAKSRACAVHANPRIAKVLDCAIFNAVFCYSESPRIARYSCYRIVRDNWVETILTAPNEGNLDFYYHNLSADLTADVWDQVSDYPDWNAVPAFNGPNVGPILAVDNCYGNICWRRDQWLALNGTDEAFSNVAHYEDVHFNVRARNAGQKLVRRGNLMYRLAHKYGNFSHRANHPPDVSFRQACQLCRSLLEAGRWTLDDSARTFRRIVDRQIRNMQ